MLEVGTVVTGRYRLDAVIGHGAMGTVYRAFDQTLGRLVAIKVLVVDPRSDGEDVVDQFLREARIAAAVQHRNVIHTIDFGTIDGTQPYMVMELLSGVSLAERLEQPPRIPREQLLHLVSLTLRGLTAVHDAGIVHRDLKPANIFLQSEPEGVFPKILDFGISRSLGNADERRSAISTQRGMIVGTPDYMAPEQARGEANITRAADIYAMGAILYEGLSGVLPFDAPNVGDLIVQIVTKQPRPIEELVPDLPQSVIDVIQQAMAKDPAERFIDARAMRKALTCGLEELRAGPTAPGARSFVDDEEQEAESLVPQGGVSSPVWGGFEGLASATDDGGEFDLSLPPASSTPSGGAVAVNSGRAAVPPPVAKRPPAPPRAATMVARQQVPGRLGAADLGHGMVELEPAESVRPLDLDLSVGPRSSATSVAYGLPTPARRSRPDGTGRVSRTRSVVSPPPVPDEARRRRFGLADFAAPLLVVVLLSLWTFGPILLSSQLAPRLPEVQLDERYDRPRPLKTTRRRTPGLSRPALRDVVFEE